MAYLAAEEQPGVFRRFDEMARRATAGVVKSATEATVPTTTGMMRWMPWVLGGVFVLVMFGSRKR